MLLLKHIVILVASPYFTRALTHSSESAQRHIRAGHFTCTFPCIASPCFAYLLNLPRCLKPSSFFSPQENGPYFASYPPSPDLWPSVFPGLLGHRIPFHNSPPIEVMFIFCCTDPESFCPHLSGIFLLTIYFLAHKQSKTGRPYGTAYILNLYICIKWKCSFLEH